MTETKTDFIDYETAGDMAEALANDIAATLAEAIEARGKAGLVVSGGSTPKALFECLCTRSLDWGHVYITLADERWLDSTHAVSNENLVYNTLLQGPARLARLISLYNGAHNAREAEDAINARLADFPFPADVVLLGMGNDGHTASLFPGADALGAALDPDGDKRCLAITPAILPEDAPYERMTLSLPALLNSKRIILMLKGAEKKATLERAFAAGPAEDMPIRAILRQTKVPVDIHWAR